MKIVNLTSEKPMGDHGLWSQQVTSSDGEQSLMWLWYMQSSIPSGLSVSRANDAIESKKERRKKQRRRRRKKEGWKGWGRRGEKQDL